MSFASRLVVERIEDAELPVAHLDRIPGDSLRFRLGQRLCRFEEGLHLGLFSGLGLNGGPDCKLNHEVTPLLIRCFYAKPVTAWLFNFGVPG
jgi:hypothetical protein